VLGKAGTRILRQGGNSESGFSYGDGFVLRGGLTNKKRSILSIFHEIKLQTLIFGHVKQVSCPCWFKQSNKSGTGFGSSSHELGSNGWGHLRGLATLHENIPADTGKEEERGGDLAGLGNPNHYWPAHGYCGKCRSGVSPTYYHIFRKAL
jgi:hypothetical protein